MRGGTHGTEVERDGVILYTHGAGIDRPVSVIRLNMVVDPIGANNTQWWGSPVAIFPHWNYQGEAIHGSFSNGAAQRCKTTGGGTVCVPIDWARGLAAYRSPMTGSATYWGSLVHGTLDQTGLKYLRNRYYNPESGRFTQEDPIGLAGGLNLYGYASGDPISYSDPFGLWPALHLTVRNQTVGSRLWSPIKEGASQLWQGMECGRVGSCSGESSVLNNVGEVIGSATFVALMGQTGMGAEYLDPVELPGESDNFVKLRGGQGYRDRQGNIWKKDMKYKDHWDVTDRKGRKIYEIDFEGNQIWPGGPKNKNK